ncbi:hypothetical protein [Cellulomonas sp. URHD0024]|uniref:hypothetical protein n=1 Tax=Cellulomonas sp. URHD0024 TaxID=1302620 RepID=UPI000414D568|nr:hypothetical protein [Cellulomonas sp. URHD0024]
MTNDAEHMVRSLRAALDGPLDAVTARPGRLRARLNAELGSAAHEHRSDVHLLVAAADERLPQGLVAAQPLDPRSVQDAAQRLADLRGWSIASSLEVVGTWAQALGLPVTERTSSTPVPTTPPEPQSNPAPGRSMRTGDAATAVPTGVVTEVPFDEGAGTEVAGLSSVVVSEIDDPLASVVGWPATTANDARRARSLGYTATHGAYRADRGVDPRFRWVILGAALALTGVLLAATGALVPYPVVLAAVLVVSLIRPGLLVVDDLGVHWHPSSRGKGVLVPWSDVRADPARPVLVLPVGRIWCRAGVRSAVVAAVRAVGSVSGAGQRGPAT